MTDTEAALLRAIGEQPDEDTPRLMYADYLDEEGSPAQAARAELIRLQVKQFRLPAGHPEAAALRERVRKLLDDWDTVWQKDMPPGFTRLAYYSRGFPFRAALTASRADGADDPRLCPIDYLELTADVPAGELEAVFRCPIFARLRELVVCGDRVWHNTALLGPSGAVALAGGNFPRLEWLDLSGHGIGDAGFLTLSESPGFPRLRYLDVRGNAISEAGLRAFRRTRMCKRLLRLNDGNNP